jgi:hypothetical protein
MKNNTFSLTRKDEEMLELIKNTEQKVLAVWAIDCARRVLPYFEKKAPKDQRPRKALETLKAWIKTGKFSMAVIREAALDAHAAARDAGDDNSARSAARACGQAVATAHVPAHSYGSAVYAQQAIFRATGSLEAVAKERDRQYRRLFDLTNN